eukprot:s4776_g1.t1
METAQQAVKTLTALWLQELQAERRALLSARVSSSSSFTVLACSTSGSGRALGCFRLSQLVAPSERGVSPRLEVRGHLLAFVCSLSRLRLFLFEARLSGYCVRERFLVLAFSTRTLKSSGVPARRLQAGSFCVGMLSLVCSTPACPELLVVVRFRGVHRCCFLG